MGSRDNWISSNSIYLLKDHERIEIPRYFCARLIVWFLTGCIMVIEFDYVWGLLFYSPPLFFCEVVLWLVRTELSRV